MSSLQALAKAVRAYWAMFPDKAWVQNGISEPGEKLLAAAEAHECKRPCDTCGGEGFIQKGSGFGNDEGGEEWETASCPECVELQKAVDARNTIEAERDEARRGCLALRAELEAARAEVAMLREVTP